MAPSESSQPARRHAWLRPEWIAVAGVMVTAFATAGALFFNAQSLRVTNKQQISDRYNTAITNLASRSIDIRLGGIYALQGVMKDSPGDQPAVIAVLCAFVRDHAPSIPGRRGGIPPPPPTDIQAALTVVGSRNTANDGHTTVVDLNHTQLASAQLVDASFPGANLFGANLTAAHLRGAILAGANLENANFVGADLRDATLTGAESLGADFGGAVLFSREPRPGGPRRGAP
jgi:pentapeptide repeat protein